jgi:hypothetical protein
MQKFIWENVSLKNRTKDIISESFYCENKVLNILGNIHNVAIKDIQLEENFHDIIKKNNIKKNKLKNGNVGMKLRNLFSENGEFDLIYERLKEKTQTKIKNKHRLSNLIKFKDITKNLKNKFKNKIEQKSKNISTTVPNSPNISTNASINYNGNFKLPTLYTPFYKAKDIIPNKINLKFKILNKSNKSNSKLQELLSPLENLKIKFS